MKWWFSDDACDIGSDGDGDGDDDGDADVDADADADADDDGWDQETHHRWRPHLTA